RLGAATASGPAYVPGVERIPEVELEPAVERARRAAEILDARLVHDPPELAAHIVVVVDDGVVTGLTLAPACRWVRTPPLARRALCRWRRPRQVAGVVAAVPVGRAAGLAHVREVADEVVCRGPLEELAVVGQAYESFEPLEEWYVAGLLARPR